MSKLTKMLCIFVAGISLLLSITSCEKEQNSQGTPEVCYSGENGIFGENVIWIDEMVRIKSISELCPLIKTIKKYPEAIPDSVYQWTKPVFTAIDVVVLPENVPENFTFSEVMIIAMSPTYHQWELDYTYRATLDITNSETNEPVAKDFNIRYCYCNNIDGSTTVKDYAMTERNPSTLTEDGKLYAENSTTQFLYFDLNPGIGIIIISLRNHKETGKLPYEYLQSLCQYKCIPIADEFDTLGSSNA